MIFLHKKKGFIFDERLVGTYRNIDNPIELKTFIIDISAKTKTIDAFMDRKSVINYHTLRVSGKLYAENYANDKKIIGNIQTNFLKGEVLYYINFRNDKGDFCYFKGIKRLSLLTFMRDVTSLEGEIFYKQTHKKISDVSLVGTNKKIKSFLKSFKII